MEKVPQDSIIQCESPGCNKANTSSKMINFIAVVGSPGHPSLSPFQCHEEEHWACSIECWKNVAKNCIENHMSKLLESKHSEMGV